TGEKLCESACQLQPAFASAMVVRSGIVDLVWGRQSAVYVVRQYGVPSTKWACAPSVQFALSTLYSVPCAPYRLFCTSDFPSRRSSDALRFLNCLMNPPKRFEQIERLADLAQNLCRPHLILQPTAF